MRANDGWGRGGREIPGRGPQQGLGPGLLMLPHSPGRQAGLGNRWRLHPGLSLQRSPWFLPSDPTGQAVKNRGPCALTPCPGGGAPGSCRCLKGQCRANGPVLQARAGLPALRGVVALPPARQASQDPRGGSHGQPAPSLGPGPRSGEVASLCQRGAGHEPQAPHPMLGQTALWTSSSCWTPRRAWP